MNEANLLRAHVAFYTCLFTRYLLLVLLSLLWFSDGLRLPSLTGSSAALAVIQYDGSDDEKTAEYEAVLGPFPNETFFPRGADKYSRRIAHKHAHTQVHTRRARDTELHTDRHTFTEDKAIESVFATTADG